MCKTLNILGYKIFIDDLSAIKINQNRKQVISTINPHSYIIAKKDKVFKEALHFSNILLPDGSGIVMAAKILRKQKIKKIAGADLHIYLLKKLNEKNGKCFYLGSNSVVFDKLQRHLKKDFPNIKASFYSPPYKDEFDEEDSKLMLNAIVSCKPDVLFIGLTAPKQEKWLYNNIDKINVPLCCSIGAVFDFYAGTVHRPSKFWINNHLEWFVRFFHEPRRLWKRNFISAPLFLWDIFLVKVNLKN